MCDNKENVKLFEFCLHRCNRVRERKCLHVVQGYTEKKKNLGMSRFGQCHFVTVSVFIVLFARTVL